MLKKLLVLLPLFLILAPTAFAGGGPVALNSFPLRPFDQTRTFILHAEIYASQPCNEINSTFAFKDSKDGDSITPYTPPDDGTYITRHYNTGQPNFEWKEICDVYAQAKSGAAEQRTATVTVAVDGKTEVRDEKVAYGDDYYSKQLQSFGRVNDADNTPQVDVISEKYLGGPKREVAVQWQKIPWAEKYVIFESMGDEMGNEFPDYLPYPSTTETKAYLNINAFYPFRLTVRACKANDPCDAVGESPYGISIDKIRNVTQTSPGNSAKTPTTTVKKAVVAIATVSPLPTNQNDAKVEELNKKVSQLEGKLQESEKKQSVLEQRVNDLLSLIKRLLSVFNR